MTSNEVRQKYIDFFVNRGHVEILPAPLVLENDPTTLFTSSGMQPLVPYLMGEKHPKGKRLVNSQPSIRVQDIEEVGDNRHTTFFEMLGNWSLGDYFKKEQLAWVWDFFTKELGLDEKRLWVSVFEGDRQVPRDNESVKIWKKIGVPESRIGYYPAKKNWWSRSGTPEEMPVGEIGGPDSEVFFDFGEHRRIHENSRFAKEKCHMNCDCGRFLEIGNSVFIQYKKNKDGKLEEMKQKNVDFGGGLERTVAAVNDEPDIFKIDLFEKIISKVEKITEKNYEGKDKIPMRIIADHIRAANAFAKDGVVPANKLQGYVMRRLVRRAVIKMKSLKDSVSMNDFEKLTQYGSVVDEVEKFSKTIERGMKLIGKVSPFDLFQTFGFPLELTEEILTDKGQKIDRDEFRREFEKHQQKSRTAGKGMFKGGLGGHSETEIKYHTATHLLHKALRDVLGDHVHQAGSNINSERLRFDFTHPAKLTEDEIAKVENEINKKIKQDLQVTKQEMAKEAALKMGALAFFPERYPDITSVYMIGDVNKPYSVELCGGPHVASTGVIGRVKIVKQESVGQGVRRIYASL